MDLLLMRQSREKMIHLHGDYFGGSWSNSVGRPGSKSKEVNIKVHHLIFNIKLGFHHDPAIVISFRREFCTWHCLVIWMKEVLESLSTSQLILLHWWRFASSCLIKSSNFYFSSSHSLHKVILFKSPLNLVIMLVRRTSMWEIREERKGCDLTHLFVEVCKLLILWRIQSDPTHL